MRRAAIIGLALATLASGLGCGSGSSGSHANPSVDPVGGLRDAVLLSGSRLAVAGYTGLDADQRLMVAVLDDTGRLLWSENPDQAPAGASSMARGELNAIAAGSDDTIFVAGRLGSEGVVYACAPGGCQTWSMNPYSQGESEQTALALHGDSLFVAGWAHDKSADPNSAQRAVLVSRLDAQTGVPRWSQLLGETPDPLGITTAFSIDVNAADRVAVAGTVARGGFASDGFVTELDLDGNVLWTEIADGTGRVGKAGTGDHDEAREARFDAAGDLYAIGTSSELGEGSNIQLVRYDTNGQREWTRQIGSDTTVVATSLDRGTAVVVGDDRVWIGGTIERPIDGAFLSEALIASFAGDGTELWRSDVAGDSTSGEELTDLALTPDGASVVAGSASSLGIGKDFILAQTKSDGSPSWTSTVERAGNDALDADRAERVLVDGSGNSYAVGTLALPDGRPGWAAVALDAQGHLRWAYPASASATAVSP